MTRKHLSYAIALFVLALLVHSNALCKAFKATLA
jgi:hypothetical protein